MKTTCSDRKSNASLKASMTPGQLPEGSTSPQIVKPGKSSGGEIFSPACTMGPKGDAKHVKI